MTKLFKLLAVLLCLLAPVVQAGGQFVVTNGTTSMILSPVVDQKAIQVISNREPNVAIYAGEIRRIENLPYIARYAGITSTNLNPSIQPKPVTTDGSVTWIRCRIGVRMGFSVQWVSGGNATVYVNGGPIQLGPTSVLAISMGSEYRGPVYATASSGDSVINIADW